MSGPTISRDAGTRLASYVVLRRRELVASIVRSPALPRPNSLASGGFANAYLDALALELEGGEPAATDAWADVQALADDDFERARIVAIAAAVLVGQYVAECGQADEIVGFIAIRTTEIERRLRGAEVGPAESHDGVALVSKDEVVASLLSAIEARDSATCDHSRAVGMWCGRIAKTLAMTLAEQRFAVLAGTLHDIGKIATPTEILLKAGELSNDEWDVMRAHAPIGATMLERIPSLRDLAPSVRAHHERIDGKGYPDRLAGDAIPMMARVVAVADSFHAMISKRPYRQPLSVANALDELRGGSGRQFDRSVVDAMLAIVQPAGMAERALRAVNGGHG